MTASVAVALAVSTWLLQGGGSVVWLAFLVILFAENSICRATAESLFGAEIAQLSPPDRVGPVVGDEVPLPFLAAVDCERGQIAVAIMHDHPLAVRHGRRAGQVVQHVKLRRAFPARFAVGMS